MAFHKNSLFSNLQTFKNTYKLIPPHQATWGALSTQFKIEQNTSIAPSLDQPWSEEVSSNPFIKTKQLFKNKNIGNSVIEDDLTNQHIFSVHKGEAQGEGEDKIFQFDSFGIHNNLVNEQPILPRQYQSNTSSEEVKIWNSSSLQINFEKVRKQELILPNPLQQQNCFFFNNNDSSIKEFCFKLNQNKQLSIENTPVKKWSELKQSKANQVPKQSHQKERIKNILYSFIEKIESTPEEHLSDQLINKLKTVFDNCDKNERMPLRQKTNQSLQTSKRMGRNKDDQSSTLRLYTQESRSQGKTERREKTETTEYKYYNGKFKVYQCSSKKETKITPLKNDKKAGKSKKFKF